MTLINLSGIHSEDYAALADDAAPQAGANILVPLARFIEDTAAFESAGSVGVIVPTETPYADLEAVADKVAFVAINFPAFGDGRGFSLAVRLRKDFGFKGEIRAIGHVIPDQALFLLRAGFDTVEAPEEREEAFKTALKRFGAFYQADMIDHGVPVPHLRHSKLDAREAS
jgi:uncharacterized protein (DUF934 family)